MQLHNQIAGIPNLTDNATEALALYSAVSTLNTTAYVILSQLESVSMQANTILSNLTEIVATNMDSYDNEINESLQLLQNVNEAQADAAMIERVVNAHQRKLYNVTMQLETLLTNVSEVERQVQQLQMSVDELQQLVFAIQDQRLLTESLFNNVTNNYTNASSALQSALQEFAIASAMEQNVTTQLQVYTSRRVGQYLYDSYNANKYCNRGHCNSIWYKSPFHYYPSVAILCIQCYRNVKGCDIGYCRPNYTTHMHIS